MNYFFMVLDQTEHWKERASQVIAWIFRAQGHQASPCPNIVATRHAQFQAGLGLSLR
jgi:hypothetical protein